MSEALKAPGIDPRHWVSYGTVCAIDDAGKPDFADPGCIYIGPEGVEVDVLLEPLGLPVTAHYYGVQGGCEVSFFTPIRPGDRVVVILPDGEPTLPPVIVAILHSNYCRVPLGTDNKPVFKNDRVLVWSQTVPVEVNAPIVRTGDETSDEPAVLGNVYSSEITTLLDALKFDNRPSPVGPIAPSPSLVAAIEAFKAALPTQLSDFIFGKKTPPAR
jgi:hypothetical protein